MFSSKLKSRSLKGYALIMVILLAAMMMSGGCQSKADKPTEKYPMPSEKDITMLKTGSTNLLSSTESKIVSTKLLRISKLDSYNLPENTLGTLKQMIDENDGKVKNLAVVEGVRDNKEKVYVLWKQDKEGKWNP